MKTWWDVRVPLPGATRNLLPDEDFYMSPDVVRLPDPRLSVRAVVAGADCLFMPAPKRRIAGPEPADANDVDELRPFLVAMSAIVALVLLLGASVLTAV